MSPSLVLQKNSRFREDFALKIIRPLTKILLFPVDCDTHEIFYGLQSNVFDAASLFQTNHVVH